VVRESSAHQVSVVQLNERVQSMERELARGRERTSDLEKKVDMQKQKLEASRNEVVEAQSKMILEVSRADELSNSLEAVKSDLAHERQRGESLSEILEQVRNDSASMKADIAVIVMQAKTNQPSGDADTNRAKVELLQAEIERLRAAESASLFNDSSRIALELAALKTQNDRLQRTHEEDTKALEALKSDNSSALRAELATSEAECRELRTKLLQKASTFKMETDTLSQNKVQALEKKVSQLSTELAHAKSNAIVLEAAVQEARAKKEDNTLTTNSGVNGNGVNMVSAETIQRAVEEARAAVEAEMTARLAASEEAAALEIKEVCDYLWVYVCACALSLCVDDDIYPNKMLSCINNLICIFLSNINNNMLYTYRLREDVL
jgi:chromosome segregation ATPase